MQFPAAFPDECQDDHIRFHRAGELSEQAGFSDAGPRKQADALTPDDGKKRVENGKAGADAIAKFASLYRRGRGALGAAQIFAAQQRFAIKRIAIRINDTADPSLGRGDFAGAIQNNGGANADAHRRKFRQN